MGTSNSFFPDRMIADKSTGITWKIKIRWYLRRSRKDLPLSHVFQVDTDTISLLWGTTVTVEGSGGVDPLRIHHISRRKADHFVETVNEWIGK
jgi:hypothetical protein